MNSLDLADVHALLAIYGATISSNQSATQKIRKFIQQLATLVHADIWISSLATLNPHVKGDIMTTHFIDDGYASEAEKQAIYEALTDVSVGKHFIEKLELCLQENVARTFRREELISPQVISQSLWGKTNIIDTIVTFLPLHKETSVLASAGFHRRTTSGPFTERERVLIHCAFAESRELHWLPQDDARQSIHLSSRERQVLVLLLAGSSKSEIAHQLKISEHTVGDYQKSIYRCFNVNSRAALQSKFYKGDELSELSNS